LVVSGWGRLSAEGEQPTVLHHVTVPFVSQKRCTDSYGSTITDNMLCAGNVKDGGVDSCQGDSGGPLTWQDPNGKIKVMGVVSFGIGCGQKGYPGVYAKVTAQLDWINQQGVEIEQNVCDSGPSTPSPTPPPDLPSRCNRNRINDGVCDDENNNMDCFYDGRDCCRQRPGWNARCTVCKCKRKGLKDTREVIADGYCDDFNNNPKSLFDGGDCCLRRESTWNKYCTYCACITPLVSQSCNWETVNDGVCDDANNNLRCFYDGQDCCFGEEGWDLRCKQCKCKRKGCKKTRLEIGDGFCDAYNNRKACNYDGGDCCLRRIDDWDKFCGDECQCKQP